MRRTLNRTLKLLAPIGAVAAMTASGGAATAQQTHTLKIAVFTPKVSSASRWFEKMKKEVAERSGGRLTLEIFYGSSMGPMPRHYDLARKGVADMSWFQHGVTPGRFPLTELTHSPYLFPPGAKGSIVGARVGADLKERYLAPEHAKVGTRMMWVVFNRPSGVYDSEKPIRSLADLKGRRYRAPTPTDVVMMKELGALPIGMPATHMAESLQKGTIDGVVTDPMGIFAFRLGGLVKYYSNMFVSVISFGLAMNPKSYDRLPGDLKPLVDEMGAKQAAVDFSTLTWADFPVFTGYMKKIALETVPMSAAADANMRDLAERVIARKIDELEKKGLPAREVYGKMKSLSAKYAGQ